jgi:hypothetical protein
MSSYGAATRYGAWRWRRANRRRDRVVNRLGYGNQGGPAVEAAGTESDHAGLQGSR